VVSFWFGEWREGKVYVRMREEDGTSDSEGPRKESHRSVVVRYYLVSVWVDRM